MAEWQRKYQFTIGVVVHFLFLGDLFPIGLAK
jgi:hypothetical protein